MYINNYYTLHKIKIIKLQHVLNFKKKCMHCLSNIRTECTFIGLQVASPCINLPAPHVIIFVIAFQPRTLSTDFTVIFESFTQRPHFKTHFAKQPSHHTTEFSGVVAE